MRVSLRGHSGRVRIPFIHEIMMYYKYTHTQTEATTGYFSCEPHPPLTLEAALAYMVEHPLDEFMRRHILNRMTAMPAKEAGALIRRTFAGAEPPMPVRALIQETALLAPQWAQDDPLFTPDPAFGNDEAATAASPLILLRWRRLPDREAHTAWGRRFADNIQRHSALPAPEAISLPPLYPGRETLDSSFGQGTPTDASASHGGAVGPESDPLGRLVDASDILGEVSDRLVNAPGPLADAPGLSFAFTAPFPAHIRAVHAEHASRQPADTALHVRPPSEETAALAEERLTAAGIIAGGQMRHTASLSPIALLRPWHIRASIRRGRHHHRLEGQGTTYGRGLSLADARASCLMEMVERASAYLSLDEDGILGLAAPSPVVTGRSGLLRAAGHALLNPGDYPLEAPCGDPVLTWMTGHAAGPQGAPVLVPVQMVSLFCNLDEIALFAAPGSTGIATGCSMEEAKIAALLEIIERDAEATTPFTKARCFTLSVDPADDPIVAALLADYAARGINVQFQDLTGPMGLPVYKCFVMTPKGAIARGHGAGLSARRAIVSALTETPFPYPDGGPSGPMLRKLPARTLRDLPDYSLRTPARALAMLEDLLIRNHRPPVYVDLTRADLGFPVVRACIPGLELAADSDAFSRVPLRLYANYLRMFRHQS